MPELDAIRGVAILGVLFYHGLYWGIDLSRFPRPVRLALSGMWAGRLGVDLFFVLSGFLITGLLIEARTRPDYYRRFYIRRALRILPAYLLVMIVLAITRYAPASFILLSLLYLSNLTPLFGIPIAYPVLWSLAVEEHFYFIWPAVIRKLRPNYLMGICAAVVLVSPISRFITFEILAKSGPVSFVCNQYTWNAADGLASGALLMLWIKVHRPTRRSLGLVCTAAVAIGLFILLAGIPWGVWTRERPVGAALQVVPWHFWFVALLGFCLILGTGPHKGYVTWRPLRFFGDISYGLYLYHLLIFGLFDYVVQRAHLNLPASQVPFLLLRFALASALAIAVSYVSRRWFENPFLNLKHRLTA
jgi:peptidoglycan/LPS O-acetylase OafA/YrhL